MFILKLIIFAPLFSFAHAESPTELDLTPMIEFFRNQVSVVKRPFKTFNWAPRPDVSNNKKRADVETSFETIQQLAKSFWSHYGGPPNQNTYGYGLYSSVDPVATNMYGQSSWRLIEFLFPAGTRILDFADTADRRQVSDPKLIADTMSIEKHYGCPVSLNAEDYFKNGGADLSRRCTQLIYTVFDQALRVDAFAYSYTATPFKDCGLNDRGYRAFVMTRAEWLKPENVYVYTADDLRQTDRRIEIQTLFLKSTEGGRSGYGQEYEYKQIIAAHLDLYPDRDVDATRTSCSEDVCTIGIRFCNPKGDCDHVELPPLPRPGGPFITEREANRSRLLWPDLVGKPKSTTVSDWLKLNKFGCHGTLPYAVPIDP